MRRVECNAHAAAGVCQWEIAMRGVKPFAGVRNADVIHRLEAGERLPPPGDMHPQLHEMMLRCWHYEPHQRPTFADLKHELRFVPFDGRVRQSAHISKVLAECSP